MQLGWGPMGGWWIVQFSLGSGTCNNDLVSLRETPYGVSLGTISLKVPTGTSVTYIVVRRRRRFHNQAISMTMTARPRPLTNRLFGPTNRRSIMTLRSTLPCTRESNCESVTCSPRWWRRRGGSVHALILHRMDLAFKMDD